MNWLKWTATTGWQAVKRTVTGERELERERVETTRLLSGIDRLQAVADAELPILVAPNDSACPCCGGKRCWPWRSSGHTSGCGGHGEHDKCWRSDEDGVRIDGCGGEGEPLPAGVAFWKLMDRTLVSPGRHTVRHLVKHAVPWRWNPIPLRTRVMLYPKAYALKLGRPVQVGLAMRFAGVLP